MTNYNIDTYGSGKYGVTVSLPTSYINCLEYINNADLISTKLRYIAMLPLLRPNMNPNYLYGLPAILREKNQLVKDSLIKEIFTFLYPLTDEEQSAFGYFFYDYIENNPGYVNGILTSYVGFF